MRKQGRLHVESTEELWTVNLDDPVRAAREMEEEEDEYGIEEFTEVFCYLCGEIAEVDKDDPKPSWCEYCGHGYQESKEAMRFLAHTIDDVWPTWTAEEKATFKDVMKRLRSCSPEFRLFWFAETTKAASNRAAERGVDG